MDCLWVFKVKPTSDSELNSFGMPGLLVSDGEAARPLGRVSSGFFKPRGVCLSLNCLLLQVSFCC